MIKALQKLRDDDQGTNYGLDEFMLCIRPKGSISGDHSNEEHEELYLISGTVDVTIGDDTNRIDTPTYIYIPPGAYRKIVAISDDATFLFKKWPV